MDVLTEQRSKFTGENGTDKENIMDNVEALKQADTAVPDLFKDDDDEPAITGDKFGRDDIPDMFKDDDDNSGDTCDVPSMFQDDEESNQKESIEPESLGSQGLRFESQQLLEISQQPQPKTWLDDVPMDSLRPIAEDEEYLNFEMNGRTSWGKPITLKPRNKNADRVLDARMEHEFTRNNNYGINIRDLLTAIEVHELENEEKGRAKVAKVRRPKGLLTEKWRPKKWTDLIGPEKTHRQMLKWLKSWSPVVFGGEVTEVNTFTNDILGRPLKKILLIHGPPGIGKTTIAHLLAKQAGYETMEINASDERAGKLVKEKIHNAMDSHRLNATGKPVCIIADELEGASEHGFINALIDLINNDAKALKFHQSQVTGAKDAKGKKKNKEKLMVRPIIGVCNDAFAGSLRQLRQHCEIISYNRAPHIMLVNKLRSICQQEKLHVNTATLNEIVTASDGDMRNCLNYLQMGISSNGTLGNKKDRSQTWVKTVTKIFKKGEAKSKKDRIADLLEDISAHGDLDKLYSGCYSVYPQSKSHDDLMRKPTQLGEWLHFYDVLDHKIYSSQQHQLGEYLPQPLLAYHWLFSSPLQSSTDKISAPDYDNYLALQSSKEMVKEIISGLRPQLRQVFDRSTSCLELAPYALHIMSPNIDSPSTLIKSDDKLRVTAIASTMLDLNIKFVKQRLENGTFVFRLEPPIESLAVITSAERDAYSVGKYIIRQLINDEYYKVRRSDAKRAFEEANPEQDKEQIRAKKKAKKEKEKKNTEAQELSKRAPFFIPLNQPAKPERETNILVVDHNERMWVQFTEGFSNAVRKDISWTEFLSNS